MEDHWNWPIAIILLLSGLLLPAVRSTVINGAAAVAVQDGALQRFAAPTLPPPVIDIAFEGTRSPLEIWHDKPLDAVQEKFWESAGVWRLRLPSDSSLQRYLLRIQYRGDVARVYAGGKLVNDNFNNDSPFDIALWRIPIDQWASLEIHILPPSQLISVTAMPVIQWNVDWEDDLQWSKDRILDR